MKAKKNNAVFVLSVCLALLLIAAMIMIIIFKNVDKNKEQNDKPNFDVHPAEVVYGVGATANLTNGNIEFLSLKNNIASLCFTSKTAEYWEPKLTVSSIKYTGKTMQ